MALVKDLIVQGKSKFLNESFFASIKSGTWEGSPVGIAFGGTGLTASPSMLVNLGSTSAANVFQASPRPGVTGTLPIANGGTGATTRLAAAQNLTNEAVTTPTHIVGLTTNWAKFGYTTISQLKTTLGLTDSSNNELYVKYSPGAVEQTIQSGIGTLSKGVINLWRNTGDHYTFLGFSNGTTETLLGGIGFKSQADKNLYRKTGSNYYKIWDENNDGTGSTLDADLLDGMDSATSATASTIAARNASGDLIAKHFKVEHAAGGDGEYRLTYSTTVDMAMMIGSANENHGLWDYKASKWMIYADLSGNVTVNGNATTATTSTSSTKVNTIKTTSANSHYLTFVDSSNASATAESMYTSDKLYIKPSTGDVYSSGRIYVNNTTASFGASNAATVWIANSSGYPIVADANVVRRGADLTTGQLGNNTYPWANTYTTKWSTANYEVSESTASRLSFANHGQTLAKGINIGDLLVSNAWADYNKVPANGIYSKGLVKSGAAIEAATYVRAKDNSAYLGTASGSQFHLKYDNTYRCVKFIFD